MAEFCKADFEILLAKDTENWKSYTLEQLLPERFTL
jgi:cytidine deaminase